MSRDNWGKKPNGFDEEPSAVGRKVLLGQIGQQSAEYLHCALDEPTGRGASYVGIRASFRM